MIPGQKYLIWDLCWASGDSQTMQLAFEILNGVDMNAFTTCYQCISFNLQDILSKNGLINNNRLNLFIVR